jgi:hypothetical protein
LYNEDIFLYTLQAQIIAKVIFYNLVPKTGEFDRARGCVPILIYCILKEIPVNIPLLILSQICASNLCTSVKGLPFGILFTRLFTHWGVLFAGQEPLSPPRPLGSSFLLKKQSHRPSIASEEATPSGTQEPGSSSSIPASSSYTLSSGIDSITLSHFAAAMHYQHDLSSEIARHLSIDMPSTTLQSHPLPFKGPPFTPWVPPRTDLPSDMAIDDDGDEGGD